MLCKMWSHLHTDKGDDNLHNNLSIETVTWICYIDVEGDDKQNYNYNLHFTL